MDKQMNVPKLRFSEFKVAWDNCKLGDLSTIRSASRVHREQWTESGVPFFRSSDVVAAYKGTENNKAFISHDLFEELSKKSGKPKRNDLLVTGGGSIGIPYLVQNDEPLYFKDADLLWFKNKKILDGFFLYEFFITSTFRRYLSSITHTGTISHYTIEQAKSTPINLPELEEQQKIASFLSKVDEKITLLTKKKEKLVEYKKGVMQQLFNGKWEERSGQLTFIPPTLRFQADDGSEFPDWEEKTLGNVAQIKGRIGYRGYTVNDIVEQGGAVAFSPTNIVDGILEHSKLTRITDSKYDESPEIQIQLDDILFVKTGSTYGKSAYVSEVRERSTINPQIVLIKAECSEMLGYFLSRVLITPNIKKQIEAFIVGGAIPTMSQEAMSKFVVPKPSLPEQTKISNFLSAIDKKISLANSELEKANEWKKGLLQQMFV